jgi:hypothetical protein
MVGALLTRWQSDRASALDRRWRRRAIEGPRAVTSAPYSPLMIPAHPCPLKHGHTRHWQRSPSSAAVQRNHGAVPHSVRSSRAATASADSPFAMNCSDTSGDSNAHRPEARLPLRRRRCEAERWPLMRIARPRRRPPPSAAYGVRAPHGVRRIARAWDGTPAGGLQRVWRPLRETYLLVRPAQEQLDVPPHVFLRGPEGGCPSTHGGNQVRHQPRRTAAAMGAIGPQLRLCCGGALGASSAWLV